MISYLMYVTLNTANCCDKSGDYEYLRHIFGQNCFIKVKKVDQSIIN